MGDRTTLWLWSFAWRTIRWLPDRLAYMFFSIAAQFAWLRQGAGVRQLEANLARVLPGASTLKIKTISRKAMHSYMRYYCDTFRLADWPTERILQTCRIEGEEPVRAALASGRGAVVALPHSGNWDHAAAWSTLALAPITTVAERLKPEELYQRFLRLREEMGMEVLPLSGTGSDVFGLLVRRLRHGGLVPLLADRDLSATGVPVQLFGETARMAAGPASLALVTGAALHPATIHYERLPAGSKARWGIVIRVSPEVPPPVIGTRAEKVAAMTQACADAIAVGIAEYPHDWHMLQRVFVADLVPEPVATAVGA